MTLTKMAISRKIKARGFIFAPSGGINFRSKKGGGLL
jgi:hypothetical protein